MKNLLLTSYEKNYLDKIENVIDNNNYETFCAEEITRNSIYSIAVISNNEIFDDMLCLAKK